MVILPLVYSLVLVATTLADTGYSTLKPDGRCKYVGQFLSHPSSRCMYVRCDYGNEPWHDSYGKVKLFAREMACAPGTSVPEYFDSAKKQGNPCTQRTGGGKCKGSYTFHRQQGAALNHGGFKAPFYGGLVGLRGKMPYPQPHPQHQPHSHPYPHPEPRKYEGPEPSKAENYESREEYPEEESSENGYNSREEYYSKGEFSHKEGYSAKEGYEPKGDRGPREEYGPKGDYSPKRDYTPKGDYPPRGDYPSQGDYPTKGDHAPRRDYQSGRDYVPPRDSFPKGDYNTESDYPPPKDDYSPRRDYSSKNGQFPKDDYPPKSDYPHSFPTNNAIHSQKGAIFPPGDHHFGGDKYDSMASNKGFEFMHQDFTKDFDSPFRSSLPSSDSDYSPPRSRYVMRGAREAPAGPYPQEEEMFPPTDSSGEEGENASHEKDSSSREDESFLKGDEDAFPVRSEHKFGSSENEGEPRSNIKESYHPLKDRFPSQSRAHPREQEGVRLSKSAFPFLKDALVALKNSFPPLKDDSDPLNKDAFTSKENPYYPTKGDFPRDFPDENSGLSSHEESNYVKGDRSRYEGPSFRPVDIDDGSDRSTEEEEYPRDRNY